MSLPFRNSQILLLALVALNIVGRCDGKIVRYKWRLEDFLNNSYAPDCMDMVKANRPVYLAENSFPGPTIDVNEGDEVRVEITNGPPPNYISIHWHGIHQVGTPYEDGTALITQCPLVPGQVKEYVWIAKPSGTHLWHAHNSMHAADGIAGAIIVRPSRRESFSHDEEMVVMLQDWYNKTGEAQLQGLLSWPFVFVGAPQSLLINGKGIAPSCAIDPSLCIASCGSDPLTQLSTITVQAGKTYRLRLINSGQLVMMNFAIAGHNFTIVQLEGTTINPVVASSVDIAPGQRVDVLLTTDQTAGSYWIETSVRERNYPNLLGKAILRYSSVPATLPTVMPIHPAWNETAFGIAQSQSYFTSKVSDYEDDAVALTSTTVKRFTLVGTQNRVIVNGNATQLVWAVNNVSNIYKNYSALLDRAVAAAKDLGWPTALSDTLDLPQNPPLTWNYSMNVWEAGGPGPAVGNVAASVVKFKKDEVVEFVLQNARALNNVTEVHPWHIHGHSFWVIGRGNGVYNETADTANYNLKNPLLQDTVTLWPSQWVAVRFVASNPGAWLFHCHILSHEMMGMAFSMLTQPNRVIIRDSVCINSLYKQTYPIWSSVSAWWKSRKPKK